MLFTGVADKANITTAKCPPPRGKSGTSERRHARQNSMPLPVFDNDEQPDGERLNKTGIEELPQAGSVVWPQYGVKVLLQKSQRWRKTRQMAPACLALPIGLIRQN